MLDLLGYAAFFLTTALIYGVLCLGLNLQWGQTGLFNVGVAGFAAIGAYTSALLTTPETAGRFGGFDMPIAVGWLGAMLASGLAATLIGAITLRLRSDYLAIATFGVAVCIQLLALNLQGVTGGPFGIGFIPRPFASLQGNALAFNLANLALVALVVAAVYIALQRLVRSPWGRVLRGIREDEAAALELGKNPFAYRLQAFVLGSAILGLAGAMQGHFIGFIAPENYISALTFQVWAMLIIGGSGNNRGAILGAIVVWGFWTLSGTLLATIVPSAFQARSAALQIVAIGVALSAVLLVRPRGLLGELRTVSRFLEP
jgi:branched-chain amino acid transport system permease protein